MNLSEALDAALPEMPKARQSRNRAPRLDPDLAVREDVLDGEPVIAIVQRANGNFSRISPMQWQLALLFDGNRTYDEIASEFAEQTGAFLDPGDVRIFAENMEESGFWYKSAQEKNLALNEKLIAERSRRTKRTSKLNFSHMRFSGWDPDRYLTWLDRVAGKYIYSPWCVMAVVTLFLFEATVFISRWSSIEPDVKLYYNFTHKSFLDLAQFWLLFLVLGFIHESSHGLTCKHFGGEVHSMGLLFLYMMPAFYVDVTEMWISATKLQRLATIIAGIWSEMVVCGIGMIVWLNTQPGEWLHDFAYQIILITGIAVILINLNPLIKLDGYYFLTEAIGIPDLKERSTGFLSGWFQNKILGLPLEVPVVPRRRAPFFILYAFISGAYSYMILFIVIRFTFNAASHWLAELALIPAGLLAYAVFKSRLRSLRGVLGQLWDRHLAGGRLLRPAPLIGIALVLIALFVPFWRDRESAYFVIEASHPNTLHAAVPGRIDAVLVRQGDQVRAGQPLLRMTSLITAAMNSRAQVQSGDARYQTVTAEMQGQSIGAGAAQQNASLRSTSLAREAQSSLMVAAPSDGTVLTENPGALIDQDVSSGQPLLELSDAGPRTARIYIPVSALDHIPPQAEVALALPGHFSIVRMTLPPPGGDPVTLPKGLIAKQDYQGIVLPLFYTSHITLPPSAGDPLIGESGQARIFGKRRSIAERIFNVAFNLARAHVF